MIDWLKQKYSRQVVEICTFSYWLIWYIDQNLTVSVVSTGTCIEFLCSEDILFQRSIDPTAPTLENPENDISTQIKDIIC